MIFEINVKNTENLTSLTDLDYKQIDEIVNALITTGGLTGVKGGSTIIHFDSKGVFQRIELKYIPWIKRR